MTDYSKWKVTDLKAELKRRGLVQTGLRVKQQFIDRIIEDDAKGESAATNGEAAPAPEPAQETPQPPATEQPAEEPAPVAATQPEEQKSEEPAQVPEPKPQAPDAAPEVPEQALAQEAPVADQPAEQQPQEAVTEPSQQTAPEPATSEPAAEAEVSQPSNTNDTQEPPAPPTQTDASAPPVEQAPDVAALQPPSDTETAKASEPADISGPLPPSVSGANTGLSTPLPQEEILEDQRKRKRRSQSPVPTVEAVANKKMKAQEEVVLPEDQDAMEVDGKADEGVAPAADVPQDAPTAEDSHGKKETSKQDVRFKGLFAPSESEQPRPASPPPDVDMDETAEPAQHVATPALYVDGLMRPLQPVALRNHLVSLAAAPGDSPNPDAIVDFYLDPIKTHCFVSFTNVSAASRVRAALHNAVWPNERNRKSLFVDFIPESKLQEWVDMEERSRKRGGPPPRWEVKYERTADGVDAVLSEIDPRGPPGRAPEPSDFSRPPPLGPRAEMGHQSRRPSDQPVAPERPSQPGQGFKPLDELFMSTTTKPKLYYLPVPRSVADRRLDRFDDLLSKGSFPRRGGDELRRISFEDGDLFVDNGAEFGRRGGGPGRGRGRGRGRGGFGDSWRGGRGGRY